MSWEHWIEEEFVNGTTIEKVEYLINRDNLKDESRKRYLVYKRNYLYYLLRKEGYPLEFIGRLFNRHHSTVINGIDTYRSVRNYKDVKHTLKGYKLILENKTLEN